MSKLTHYKGREVETWVMQMKHAQKTNDREYAREFLENLEPGLVEHILETHPEMREFYASLG